MVLDDIIVDMAPIRAALGARFNVNVRHSVLSLDRFHSYEYTAFCNGPDEVKSPE